MLSPVLSASNTVLLGFTFRNDADTGVLSCLVHVPALKCYHQHFHRGTQCHKASSLEMMVIPVKIWSTLAISMMLIRVCLVSCTSSHYNSITRTISPNALPLGFTFGIDGDLCMSCLVHVPALECALPDMNPALQGFSANLATSCGKRVAGVTWLL